MKKKRRGVYSGFGRPKSWPFLLKGSREKVYLTLGLLKHLASVFGTNGLCQERIMGQRGDGPVTLSSWDM